MGGNPKNFSGDFLAEIGQKPYFDTRLTEPEGTSGTPCLAAFFICAGSEFVNLFNQASRLSVLGDFEPQPRVKVGILSNLAQYFCRKIDFTLARDFGNFCSPLNALPGSSQAVHSLLFSLLCFEQ